MKTTHVFCMLVLVLIPQICYAELTPPQIRIKILIENEALQQKVPVELALAFAEVETMFQDKRSGRSYGPLQVDESSLKPDELKQLRRLDWNIRKGITIMKANLKRAKGHAEKARYMYVCGRLYNRSCSKEKIKLIKNRWSSVASKWEVKNVYQQFSF